MRKLLIFALAALTGCSTLHSDHGRFAGRYENMGFNSSSTLLLKVDGTYKLEFSVTNCDLTGYGGWETGHWEGRDDVITLEADREFKGTKTPWYARLRFSGNAPNRHLVCDIPTEWAYRKGGFDENQPNQSLEPTGIAGTSSADAEAAPAMPVAHH